MYPSGHDKDTYQSDMYPSGHNKEGSKPDMPFSIEDKY
jgi:hypothetical protein